MDAIALLPPRHERHAGQMASGGTTGHDQLLRIAVMLRDMLADPSQRAAGLVNDVIERDRWCK